MAHGMAGASLTLLLDNPEQDDVRRHQYYLVPREFTNAMEYVGGWRRLTVTWIGAGRAVGGVAPRV